MATHRRKAGVRSEVGMWPTISAAVQSGWGPTGRLLVILIALVAFIAVAGDSSISFVLGALLTGSK